MAHNLAEALKEPVGRCSLDVEIKYTQHPMFLLQNLLLSVSVISDVYKVFHNRRIDLLILAGNKHGGYTHQLQLLSVDLFFLQVSIDKINSQVEALRYKLELQVNLYEPIDQNGAHAFINVNLVPHVSRIDRVVVVRLILGLEKPIKNFLSIF